MNNQITRRINVNNGKQVTMLNRKNSGNQILSVYIESKGSRVGLRFFEHTHVKEFYLNDYTVSNDKYETQSIFKEIKKVTGNKFNQLTKKNMIDFIIHTLEVNDVKVTDDVKRDVQSFIYR